MFIIKENKLKTNENIIKSEFISFLLFVIINNN